MGHNISRIHVIDALRGFAIVSILLLHNLEHFDYYFIPPNLPAWMTALDQGIWETLFFLFAGKSYAIFALLFGLTYYIQSKNQEALGKDFRWRFAWRMILLLGFGLINSAFFQGDILSIYAVIGLLLIPVNGLSNKTILIIAIIAMLQPAEWLHFLMSLSHTVSKLPDPVSWSYFGKMGEYIPGPSFINTAKGNLTNGKSGVLLWNWENGRVFQTYSLFLLGLLAGRLSLFIRSEESQTFWVKTLQLSGLVFIPLFIIKTMLPQWIKYESISRPLLTIETSWTNFSFMLVLVSGFVLLFRTETFNRFLNIFSPLGRMSLSNYVMQSIVGSYIYYGFGLGLYQYTGATYSLIIGVGLAIMQGYFSVWWFRKYPQGPLETIWHRLTWLGTGTR